MCRIKVKNFGPIREGMADDAWIDVKKVAVFIGSQGSGKSTIAKLISCFSWIEKMLLRGDYQSKYFIDDCRFRKNCLAYHRIDDFLREQSYMAYEGESYSITYADGQLSVKELCPHENAALKQVLYVPAERNFISNVKSFKGFKNLSPAFSSFIDDFQSLKESLKGDVPLPINQASVEYDDVNDVFNIKGEDYKLRLMAASSGFQSLTPLFLISRYYTQKVYAAAHSRAESELEERTKFKKIVEQIWADLSLSEEQKYDALSVIAKRFTASSLFNIVEEPEQNLYPSSQRELLYQLLEYNNTLEANKLIITTHSPYIVNYLTLAVLASQVGDSKQEALSKLINPAAVLAGDQVSIYACDEKDGSIRLLQAQHGCPTSQHALNEFLGDSNDVFSDILSLI